MNCEHSKAWKHHVPMQNQLLNGRKSNPNAIQMMMNEYWKGSNLELKGCVYFWRSIATDSLKNCRICLSRSRIMATIATTAICKIEFWYHATWTIVDLLHDFSPQFVSDQLYSLHRCGQRKLVITCIVCGHIVDEKGYPAQLGYDIGL